MYVDVGLDSLIFEWVPEVQHLGLGVSSRISRFGVRSGLILPQIVRPFGSLSSYEVGAQMLLAAGFRCSHSGHRLPPHWSQRGRIQFLLMSE